MPRTEDEVRTELERLACEASPDQVASLTFNLVHGELIEDGISGEGRRQDQDSAELMALTSRRIIAVRQPIVNPLFGSRGPDGRVELTLLSEQ